MAEAPTEKMGMFKQTVRVMNPADPSRYFEEEFWVDTGALYSFAPADRLEEIGLAPLQSRDMIFADGRQQKCPFGEAKLNVLSLNETMTCPIVFAPKDSLYLLGATALESFGVDAD